MKGAIIASCVGCLAYMAADYMFTIDPKSYCIGVVIAAVFDLVHTRIGKGGSC